MRARVPLPPNWPKYEASAEARANMSAAQTVVGAERAAENLLARRPAVEEAVRLYVEGKSMEEIAEKHGIKSSTLMRWMLAELGPEFEKLREAAVLAKAIENYEKLEKATTYIEVMRNGQLVKHWNWMLERLVRSRFGPSLDVNATVKVELPDVAETARRMAFLLARGGQTVEGVAIVVPDMVPGALLPESVVADEIDRDRLEDG